MSHRTGRGDQHGYAIMQDVQPDRAESAVESRTLYGSVKRMPSKGSSSSFE